MTTQSDLEVDKPISIDSKVQAEVSVESLASKPTLYGDTMKVVSECKSAPNLEYEKKVTEKADLNLYSADSMILASEEDEHKLRHSKSESDSTVRSLFTVQHLPRAAWYGEILKKDTVKADEKKDAEGKSVIEQADERKIPKDKEPKLEIRKKDTVKVDEKRDADGKSVIEQADDRKIHKDKEPKPEIRKKDTLKVDEKTGAEGKSVIEQADERKIHKDKEPKPEIRKKVTVKVDEKRGAEGKSVIEQADERKIHRDKETKPGILKKDTAKIDEKNDAEGKSIIEQADERKIHKDKEPRPEIRKKVTMKVDEKKDAEGKSVIEQADERKIHKDKEPKPEIRKKVTVKVDEKKDAEGKSVIEKADKRKIHKDKEPKPEIRKKVTVKVDEKKDAEGKSVIEQADERKIHKDKEPKPGILKKDTAKIDEKEDAEGKSVIEQADERKIHKDKEPRPEIRKKVTMKVDEKKDAQGKSVIEQTDERKIHKDKEPKPEIRKKVTVKVDEKKDAEAKSVIEQADERKIHKDKEPKPGILKKDTAKIDEKKDAEGKSVIEQADERKIHKDKEPRPEIRKKVTMKVDEKKDAEGKSVIKQADERKIHKDKEQKPEIRKKVTMKVDEKKDAEGKSVIKQADERKVHKDKEQKPEIRKKVTMKVDEKKDAEGKSVIKQADERKIHKDKKPKPVFPLESIRGTSSPIWPWEKAYRQESVKEDKMKADEKKYRKRKSVMELPLLTVFHSDPLRVIPPMPIWSWEKAYRQATHSSQEMLPPAEKNKLGPFLSECDCRVRRPRLEDKIHRTEVEEGIRPEQQQSNLSASAVCPPRDWYFRAAVPEFQTVSYLVNQRKRVKIMKTKEQKEMEEGWLPLEMVGPPREGYLWAQEDPLKREFKLRKPRGEVETTPMDAERFLRSHVASQIIHQSSRRPAVLVTAESEPECPGSITTGSRSRIPSSTITLETRTSEEPASSQEMKLRFSQSRPRRPLRLQTHDLLSFKPVCVNFTDFLPQHTYRKTVAMKNISNYGVHFDVLPLDFRAPMTIDYKKTVGQRNFLAPGQTITLGITYHCKSFDDSYLNNLIIRTPNADDAVIPICARSDPPVLRRVAEVTPYSSEQCELEPDTRVILIDLGQCLLGQIIQMDCEIINEGGPSEFMIVNSREIMKRRVECDCQTKKKDWASTGEFLVEPAMFPLKRKQTQMLTVTFMPDMVGLFVRTFYMLSSNYMYTEMDVMGECTGYGENVCITKSEEKQYAEDSFYHDALGDEICHRAWLHMNELLPNSRRELQITIGNISAYDIRYYWKMRDPVSLELYTNEDEIEERVLPNEWLCIKETSGELIANEDYTFTFICQLRNAEPGRFRKVLQFFASHLHAISDTDVPLLAKLNEENFDLMDVLVTEIDLVFECIIPKIRFIPDYKSFFVRVGQASFTVIYVMNDIGSEEIFYEWRNEETDSYEVLVYPRASHEGAFVVGVKSYIPGEYYVDLRCDVAGISTFYFPVYIKTADFKVRVWPQSISFGRVFYETPEAVTLKLKCNVESLRFIFIEHTYDFERGAFGGICESNLNFDYAYLPDYNGTIVQLQYTMDITTKREGPFASVLVLYLILPNDEFQRVADIPVSGFITKPPPGAISSIKKFPPLVIVALQLGILYIGRKYTIKFFLYNMSDHPVKFQWRRSSGIHAKYLDAIIYPAVGTLQPRKLYPFSATPVALNPGKVKEMFVPCFIVGKSHPVLLRMLCTVKQYSFSFILPCFGINMEKLPAVKCRYPDRRKKQSTELNHEDSQKPNSGALTPLRVSDTKELKDYVFCSTDRHRFMGESESDDSDELDLVLNLEMEPDPASYLILNEVMENFTIPFKRPIKLLNDRRKTMVTVNGDMKFQVHVGTSVMKDIDEVSEESPEVLITPGGSPAEHSNRDVKKKLCFAEERLEEVVCDHLEDTCHEEDRTETHRKGDKGLKLVGFQLNTDEVIEEDDKREENVGTKRSEEINQDTDKIDEQGESIIMNVQPLITESSLEKVKELKDDDDITEEEQIENNLSISVIFPFSPEKCIDYSDVGFFADDDESELDSIKRRKKKIRGKSFPTKLHTGEGHERSGIVVQKTSDSKYINSINLRRNIKHIDYDSTLIGSEIFSFFPRDSQDRYETAYSAAKTEFYPDLLCKYSPSEIKTEFLHIPSESIQHIEEELGSSSTESSSSECFGYEFPSQYFDEDSINVMKKYRYQLVSNETSAKGIHYLKSMIDIINLSDDPDQKYSSSHSLDRSLEDTLLSSPQLLLHTAEERGVSCQEDNKCLTKKCDVRDLPHKEDTYHSKDDVVERYKKFLKKQARRTGTHFAPLPPTETDSEGRVIPLHRTVPKILIGKEYDPCSAVIAQPGAHPSFERFLQLGYFGTEFQHKHHILGFQPGYVEAVVKRYEEKTEELRKKKRILKMKSLQAEENEENVVGEPEKEEDDIRALEIDEELSGEQTNSIKGRLSEEEEEEAKSEEHELRTESIKEICIKAKDKSEKTKSENGNLGGLVIGKWEDDTVKREEESSDKDDDGIKVIYCRPMGENAEFKAHFEWSTESFKTYFDSSSNTSDSDTSSNKSDSSTSSSTSLPQKTICELYSGNISHTSVSYSNLDSNMVSSEPSIPPLPCGSSDEDLVIANDEITRLKKISNLKQLPKAYFCLKESHEICRTYQALSDKLISFIRILDDREDEWWKIPVNDFCCEDMQVTYPKDFLTPCSKKLLFIETPVGRKRLAYFDECLLQKECICKVTYRSLESIKNNPISWDEVSGLFPNKNKEDNFSNLNPSNIDPTAGSLLEIDPEALIAVKEYEIWPLRRDLIYELVQFFFIPITFRPEYYSVNMKTYWSFVGDVKGDAKKNRKKENSLKKALALLGAKLFDPCRPCCKRVNILPKVTALLSHKASEISPIGKVILTNFVCFTRRKVVIKLKNRTPYQLQYMVNGTYFSDPPKEEISTKLNIALAKPTVRQDLSVTIPKQCGIIPPKGIIKVRIYVAASTWGIYEERLVFYLEGMKPCEVSLTVQVEDSPVVFPGILRAVRNIPTTRYLCEELASKHYMALAVKNASNDPVNVEWHCFVIEPNEFEWPQGIRYMLLQLRKLCEEKNQIISGIFRRRIKELVRQLYFNRKADLETLSTNYLGKDQEDTVMDTETEQEIILLMNMCDVILHNEYHVKETLPEEDEKNYYRVLDESSHLIPNELNWLRFCYHALGWDIGTRRDMKIQSVLIGLIKRATDTPIEPEGRCSRGEEFNTQPVLLHLQALVPFPRLIMDGTDEDNLSFKFKAMDILHQVEGSNIVSKKYYLMNDDDILVSVRLHVKKPFYIAGYHLISTESNSSGSLTYSGEKSSSENNVLRIPPRSCAEIEVTCQLTRVHVYKARAVMVEAQQQYLPYYVYPELNQKSIAVDAKLSIIHTPELRQHFPLQLEVVFPTIRVNTYEVNFSNVNIMDHKEMWILLRNYSDQPFEYDIDTTNVTNFVIWNNYTNLEGMGEVSIKICFHPRTLGPHAETFYIYNTFFKDEQQEITVRGYAYLVSPEIDKQNEEIIRQQRERENLKNLRQKAAKKKLTDAEREMLKELELQESMVPKDDVEKTAKVKGKEKRKRQLKRWETEDWLNISIPFWEKNFNSCQDRTGRRSSEPSIPQLFDTEDKADLSKTTVWAPNPFTRGLLSQSQNNNDPDDSTETESNNAGPRPQLGL